ncbi:hypothetical protein C3387_03430 [Leclercia sp. LSNIH6]|nr:hypothetical protein C3370_03430 [Leclercia sp. LSNIH7]POU80014.1 hypothetical protein C3387_03430 [Leclercia sp. LSNIH6]POW50978.1 hypothetical protein C3406_12700 [Leclercia sp. LSNIH8]
MTNKVDATCSRNFYFIHLYNDHSGSPRVLREMVDSISDNRHIITSNTDGILSGINGVTYSKFRYFPARNLFFKLFFYLVANINIFFILLRLLIVNRKTKNIVIVNTMLPFGALLASKLTNTPVTSYVHETSVRPALLKKFLRAVIEVCASNVIFVSKFLFDKEKFKRITNQEIIYNPVSPNLVSAPKDINYIGKFNARNVIFISSLLAYKGIADLIDIAKLSLMAEDQIIYTLVLNCTEKQLEEFLTEQVLPQNIQVICRPDDLRKLYLKSSFVLNLTHPNIWLETFGLTLVEGMANGCIPIGPVAGAPVELIEKNYGFNIDHKDHSSIRDAIVSILSDFKSFEFYAKNAKTKSDFFSLKVFQDKINDFIDGSF